MKKLHLVFAILSLCLSILFVVLCICTFLPTDTSFLTVKEVFAVSPANNDYDGTNYTMYLTGVVLNTSDSDFTPEQLKIVVTNGKTEKAILLNNVTMYARLKWELNQTFDDTVSYHRVKSVSFLQDGKWIEIENATEHVNYFSFIFLAICLAFAWLCYFNYKKYTFYIELEKITNKPSEEIK